MRIVLVALAASIILSACGGTPVIKSTKKLKQNCSRVVATFAPNDADMVPAGFCTCLSEALAKKTSPENLEMIANEFTLSKNIDEFEDRFDKIAEDNKQIGKMLMTVSDICMADQ